jgi:hypothetical protein
LDLRVQVEARRDRVAGLMHGPCESFLNWCPKFGDGAAGTTYIRVVDDVAATLRPLHRTIWRTARDRALAEWEAAGVRFVVTEGTGVRYDGGMTGITSATIALIIPKTIRLVRNVFKPPTGTYAPEDFAWYVADVDGSLAVYTPDPAWWKRYYLPNVTSTVCHELGHCLGLWHRTDGGVMAGGQHPDAHDLDSVRAYYLA